MEDVAAAAPSGSPAASASASAAHVRRYGRLRADAFSRPDMKAVSIDTPLPAV
jgi:hypothetical protein